MGNYRRFIEGMEYLVNTYQEVCLSLSKGYCIVLSEIPIYLHIITQSISYCSQGAVRWRFLPNPVVSNSNVQIHIHIHEQQQQQQRQSRRCLMMSKHSSKKKETDYPQK